MVPLLRCHEMEKAVTLLGKHYKHILINATFNLIAPIRFRADLVTGIEFFFSKTNSQVNAWRERGGALYVLLKRNWKEETYGPSDVSFFVECPRSVQLFDDACQETKSLAVIFKPPTWAGHVEFLNRTMAGYPPRLVRREFDKLERIKQLVEGAPLLTRRSLARLQRDQTASPLQSSSCALALPADAAHAIRTDPAVP